MDGKYCATMKMTPLHAKPGETPVAIYSDPECVTVTAPDCEITAKVTFNGTLDNSTHQLTLEQSIGYTINKWCNNAALNFYYEYNWG